MNHTFNIILQTIFFFNFCALFYSRYLEETRYANTVEFKGIYVALRRSILRGYLESIICFIIEIVYFRWKRKRSLKRMADLRANES